MRQSKAVAKHNGLRRRTTRGRVEAHLARVLIFDFQSWVKEWSHACDAQWWDEHQADLPSQLPGPVEPIE